MSLSNRQKMLLHVASKAAGVIEESDRRLVQRNLGGFYSAADSTATRQGFIACMAHYERLAGGALDGFTAGYWVGEDAKATPVDGLLWNITQQAGRMGWDPDEIDRFLAGKHMSSGTFSTVHEANAYWLTRLLEAMKAMARRRARF
jgi:hypothetical protein